MLHEQYPDKNRLTAGIAKVVKGPMFEKSFRAASNSLTSTEPLGTLSRSPIHPDCSELFAADKIRTKYTVF